MLTDYALQEMRGYLRDHLKVVKYVIGSDTYTGEIRNVTIDNQGRLVIRAKIDPDDIQDTVTVTRLMLIDDDDNVWEDRNELININPVYDLMTYEFKYKITET